MATHAGLGTALFAIKLALADTRFAPSRNDRHRSFQFSTDEVNFDVTFDERSGIQKTRVKEAPSYTNVIVEDASLRRKQDDASQIGNIFRLSVYSVSSV